MSPEFEVGEIAIYWRPGATRHRMEVTIASPLVVRGLTVDRVTGHYDLPGHRSYQVMEKPSGVAWYIKPRYLRKRQPPPQFEAGSWPDCLFKPKRASAFECALADALHQDNSRG